MGRGKRSAGREVALSSVRTRLAPTGDLSWPEIPKRPVPAGAHSDDWGVEVSFDARAYFEQASDRDLVALARESYCNSYEADAVADFYREDETKPLFDYLDKNKRDLSGNRIGFEVEVDDEAAEAWLDENRPHLLPWLNGECSFATPRYQVVAGEFISDDLGGSQGLEWEVRNERGETVKTFYEADGHSEQEAVAFAEQLELLEQS